MRLSLKERRMEFATATLLNRKSGGSVVERPAFAHHPKPIPIKATTLRLVINRSVAQWTCCVPIQPLRLIEVPHVLLRSLFRITSFNPDQVSSTAHTLTSTKPSGNASARISSSFTSEGTFEAFFGHETQIVPPGSSTGRSLRRIFDKSTLRVTKMWAISIPLFGDASRTGIIPLSRISSATVIGIPDRQVRCPSFTPSFFAKGVPEYPETIFDSSMMAPIAPGA
jgi:hypothetical protein